MAISYKLVMIHSDMVEKSYSITGYHQLIDMNIPIFGGSPLKIWE